MEMQRRPQEGPPPLPKKKGDTEIPHTPFADDMKAAREATAQEFKRKDKAKPAHPGMSSAEIAARADKEIGLIDETPAEKFARKDKATPAFPSMSSEEIQVKADEFLNEPIQKKPEKVGPPPLKPGARVRAGMPPNVEPIELKDVVKVDASVPNIENIDPNQGEVEGEVPIIKGQKIIQAEQPVVGERSLEDAIDQDLKAEQPKIHIIQGTKLDNGVSEKVTEQPNPDMTIMRGTDQFAGDFDSTTGVSAKDFQKPETIQTARERKVKPIEDRAFVLKPDMTPEQQLDVIRSAGVAKVAREMNPTPKKTTYAAPDLSKRPDLQPPKRGFRALFSKLFGRG